MEDFSENYGPRFGIRKKNRSCGKIYSRESPESLILSKLYPGIGFTGIDRAGSVKIPYKQYFKTCFFHEPYTNRRSI